LVRRLKETFPRKLPLSLPLSLSVSLSPTHSYIRAHSHTYTLSLTCPSSLHTFERLLTKQSRSFCYLSLAYITTHTLLYNNTHPLSPLVYNHTPHALSFSLLGTHVSYHKHTHTHTHTETILLFTFTHSKAKATNSLRLSAKHNQQMFCGRKEGEIALSLTTLNCFEQLRLS